MLDDTTDHGLVLLRFAPALVFLMHGGGRLLGVGPYAGSVGGFAGFLGGQGVPAAMLFAWLVTLLEVVGGLALLAGALTRLFALGLAVNMLVATVLVHLPNGYAVGDGGYELSLTLLLLMLAVALTGPGDHSVDRRVFEEEPTPRALWERVAGG